MESKFDVPKTQFKRSALTLHEKHVISAPVIEKQLNKYKYKSRKSRIRDDYIVWHETESSDRLPLYQIDSVFHIHA